MMKRQKNLLSSRSMGVLFAIAFMFSASFSTCAQSRLKPCEMSKYEIWSRTFVKYYQKGVAQMIVSPSFSKSYAFYVMKNDTLAVKTSEQTYQMVCDSILFRHLNILIHHSVSTSMYIFERLGFDGTEYFFFDGGDGACCWTPTGTCGRLVNVMKKVADAVKTGDEALLQEQRSRVDSLILVFKGYYPDDFTATRTVLHHIIGSGRDEYDVELSSYNGAMRMVFAYSASNFNPSIQMTLKSKYDDMLQEVAKWTFLNTMAMDMYRTVKITIDNNSPFNVRVSRGNVEFTLQEKDLSTEKLIELLKEHLPHS
jgi:hypothetical protein